MKHFCTYFDQYYLLRGLSLYRSLLKYGEPITLYVLCFDDLTYTTLRKINQPSLVPISLQEFEARDTALLEAKKSRSVVEYFFTCSPSFPLFIFRNFAQVDLISYVDSDLHFFSSVEPIYSALGDKSILIIEHRFPDHLKYLEKRGVFNVGMILFRRDRYGLECLRSWREQCLEWCYEREEDEKYADQKYLDAWPLRFERHLVVLKHKGANVAPWNWMNFAIESRKGVVTVDGDPLIFYHFAGMQILNRWLSNAAVSYYGRGSHALRKDIYRRYLRDLGVTRKWLSRVAPHTNPAYSIQRSRRSLIARIASGIIHREILISIGDFVF